MKEIQALGALLEDRWRRMDYAQDAFAVIAREALQQADLPRVIDPWDVVRWVHATPSLPAQMDLPANFGDPPVTLFSGSRFVVDVYFWLDSTTAIHQHAFSGAFQVLAGSSVHCSYGFEQETQVNPHLLVGDLKLLDVSLLEVGDVREIHSGPRFIHSLFHLERPSVTITVRTRHAPLDQVQYRYLKPSLAVDDQCHDEAMIKKVQTVTLLLAVNHPDADPMISALLDDSDFQTAFQVLSAAFKHLGRNPVESLFGLTRSRDRFEVMLQRAVQRHGHLAGRLPAVFAERDREADIIRRRKLIEGPQHRFLLALLLNVQDREKLIALVAQRFPEGDPVDRMLAWVEEIAAIRIVGQREPNALGIAGFGRDHLLVLAGLLRGRSEDEIQQGVAGPVSQTTSVRGLAKDLRESAVFRGILGPPAGIAG